MVEFLMFLETLLRAGWLFFCALAAVAAGFLIFDRRPKRRAAAQGAHQRGRLADEARLPHRAA